MKNKTEICGYILRCPRKEITAKFYEILGLHTHEHQHGGPLHIEVGPIRVNSVLEIYARSENYFRDSLMVQVVSIDYVLRALETVLMIKARTGIIRRQNFKFAYISDPDDRDVMLIEKSQINTAEEQGNRESTYSKSRELR